jgi:hypothetical protein
MYLWSADLRRVGAYRFLTLALFLIVSGALIVGSDFLPFGTDNNETFSSLLHARNMVQNGLFSFGGLTNETTSSASSAQAFLYTHQGNFPRFFAYILYVLGAKSAESQILISTASIGVIGIMMAHVFMERRVDPLFAFLFCGVLTTDYLMSLQWLVNTWRVWHLLFFFAPLVLADRLTARGPDAASLAGLFATFAALFYYEITYAVFVAFVFAVYLGIQARRRPGVVIYGWLAGGAGALFAVAALISQIVAVFGWDGFVRDFSLTFFSRNDVSHLRMKEFQEETAKFMKENNIVFWDSFNSIQGGIKDPWVTLQIFFRYSLIPMTPPIVMIGLVMTAGVFVRGIADAAGVIPARFSRFLADMKKPVDASVARSVILPAFILFGSLVIVSSRALGLEGKAYFLTSNQATVPFTILAVALGAVVLRIWQADRKASLVITELIISVLVAIYFAITIVLLDVKSPATIIVVLALAIVSLVLYRRLGQLQLNVGRLVGAVAMLAFCSLLARGHASLYLAEYSGAPSHFDPLTLSFINQLGGPTVWKIIVLLAGCVSTLFIVDPPARPRFSQLAAFIGAGTIAFILVTTLFFGYIVTAYEARNCPFAVYVVAVIPACALYVTLRSLTSGITVPRWTFSVPSVARVMAAPVVAFLMITWVSAQTMYLRVLAPGRMTGMFHQLAQVGGTSVVGTYATPVAMQTGAWSYFDPAFFVDAGLRDGREISRRDYRYLWFADAKTNVEYRTPEYFICWVHLNIDNAVGDSKQWRTCGDFGGIKEIRDGTSPFHHVEIARDTTSDLWSIIRLDWSGSRQANTPSLSGVLPRSE